jgi:tetratricopeptide (TPR) repeat protein
MLGLVGYYREDAEDALALLSESLPIARGRDIRCEVGASLSYQAFIFLGRGELSQAAALFRQSLALFRPEMDAKQIAFTLYGLGLVALRQADYPQAAEHLGRSLTLSQSWDDQYTSAAVLDALGSLAQAESDHAGALAYFQKSLQLRNQLEDEQGLAETLEHMIPSVADPHSAVLLLGAAHTLRQAIEVPVPPVARADYEAQLNALGARLDEAAFSTAWDAGASLPLAQVVSHALAVR